MRGRAAATLLLEQAVLEIAAERAPITVRGIAYALFTRGLIPSMAVGQTQKVGRITTRMREEGTLDWTQIVDDSRMVERPSAWDDPDEIIEDTVRGYRRNNWQEQPTIVEVWSEKGTVGGILAPVLDELGCAFRVMKGFGSFTSVRQAAEDSNVDLARNQETVALYVGDWDPSGLYMSDADLPERLERYGGQVQLKRIALLREDIARLPHFEARTKAKDPRYRWFVERYGRRCWELDAMDPNDLRERVRQVIEAHIDRTLWNRAIETEQAEIESLKDFHKNWQSRLSGPMRNEP